MLGILFRTKKDKSGDIVCSILWCVLWPRGSNIKYKTSFAKKNTQQHFSEFNLWTSTSLRDESVRICNLTYECTSLRELEIYLQLLCIQCNPYSKGLQLNATCCVETKSFQNIFVLFSRTFLIRYCSVLL